MVGLMYRNVCTICDAVNVDSVERDICAACTPSAKKNSATATPQEKKSSATPSLKLFKILVYTAVSVSKSIILEVDKEAALTHARLGPGDRQEVTEIEGPFRAGFVIHEG